MTDVCGIVLAAGKSTRMPLMKQLMPWDGKPLLEFQINRLATLPLKEVVVILGHEANLIRQEINVNCQKVKFVICEQYEEGLSASLKCALSYASSSYSSVLLLLADLPLLWLDTIRSILKIGNALLQLEDDPFSIQPKYVGKKGHPVFLGHFQKLDWKSLSGDSGAKSLIEQLEKQEFFHTDDIGTTFDVDTPEAYELALKIAKKDKEVI